jgi:hypothetical protein
MLTYSSGWSTAVTGVENVAERTPSRDSTTAATITTVIARHSLTYSLVRKSRSELGFYPKQEIKLNKKLNKTQSKLTNPLHHH